MPNNQNQQKPFSSKEKYQFVCHTCNAKGTKTSDWDMAKSQAESHRASKPSHNVDIYIYQSIVSSNNFL